MSRRFTPEHKAVILTLLDANNGNIPMTADQANITERTLYRWKRQQALTLPPQQERQLPSLSLDASESQEKVENELLRRYLRQAALQIASELSDSIQSPDLMRRINALNSLLDRLDLMHEENPDEPQTETLRLEFVDATGRISSIPPWANDGDDEDESDPQPDYRSARIEDAM